MINKELLKDIEEYCKYNDIIDVPSFINKILEIGFNIEKYGIKPSITLKVDEIKEKNIENNTQPEVNNYSLNNENPIVPIIKKNNDNYDAYDL